MGARAIETDIIIVGGGLSGLAAAIFAAKAGFATIHLAPKTAQDPRTSALMEPSVTPLIEAGLIDNPDTIGTPLTKIRIIDSTDRLFRSPEALFDSATAGVKAFGWNFSNSALRTAFESVASGLSNYRRLDDVLSSYVESDSGVKIQTGNAETLNAKMLVGADGKSSLVRRLAGIDVHQQQHRQSALVCDLRLQRGLDGTSVEFHYENGPFTLVPAGGNIANLVWIDDGTTLKEAQAKSPDALAGLFSTKAQNLFGSVEVLTPTTVFPLSTLRVATAGQGSVALVGEAAHAFPPIGAQGLNLGLRDVVALRQALDLVNRDELDWAQKAVSAYARERQNDLQNTTTFVEGLFKSLIVDFLPAQLMRAGGLWALKLSPTLRQKAMAFGMGAH